ncbi:sigma-54 interaction domain-containing protein [Candidatus Formimonas warabiya]|uniref:sigma-54 interaction domain-containing protein n=1 Tax=Formimonas warabiya TaxID=1761012 RepID=UPI0011D14563|nr:sigma 54-interacting transcriptional regulator [Candidatus Formimonas warabiya]
MISMNIICQVDRHSIIRNIISINRSNNNNHRFDLFLDRPLKDFINLDDNSHSGIITIEGTTANYYKFTNPCHDNFTVFITNSIYCLNIYEAALDKVSDGINIFDKNGYLLFSNIKAQQIENSNRKVTIGKHLLDIYHFDLDKSQRQGFINSENPINDYCDYFKSQYSNQFVSTLNSTLPVFVNNEMEAIVSVVNSKEQLESNNKKLLKLKACLKKDKPQINSKSINMYYSFRDIIGNNPDFLKAVNLASLVADRECSVLLYGETGTGKELFAQSIHSASLRKTKNFVALNCAAIPENLAESILFGTEKGSFTGSINKEGLLFEANGGTILLDELNSLEISIQAKLLRVLQEKKYRKVGGSKDIDCDVRIISAINEDPLEAVESGKIRSDLFYRLNTISIHIPPLRDRSDDIILLCEYFLNKYNILNNSCYSIHPDVIQLFKNYLWPGNTRELLHAIEYSVTIAKNDIITLNDIPTHIKNSINTNIFSSPKESKNKSITSFTQPFPSEKIVLDHLDKMMEEYEKKIIITSLTNHAGNITKTAEALGISRQGMQYRIKKYHIHHR